MAGHSTLTELSILLIVHQIFIENYNDYGFMFLRFFILCQQLQDPNVGGKSDNMVTNEHIGYKETTTE